MPENPTGFSRGSVNQCERIAKAVIAKEFRQKEKQVTLEWKQAREEGKIARRITTDAIKEFEEYAKSQGSKNPQNYSMISNWIDDGFVPGGSKEVKRLKKELGLKSGRDGLDMVILRNIEYGEMVIFPTIFKNAKEEGKHYKEMKKIFKDTFLQVGKIISNGFLLQNNTKALTTN